MIFGPKFNNLRPKWGTVVTGESTQRRLRRRRQQWWRRRRRAARRRVSAKHRCLEVLKVVELQMLFSSHFGNLVFGCFWQQVTKILRNSLFFIFSCPSCLANGQHCTKNHATKVTKKLKTKLPKYVSNEPGKSI